MTLMMKEQEEADDDDGNCSCVDTLPCFSLSFNLICFIYVWLMNRWRHVEYTCGMQHVNDDNIKKKKKNEKINKTSKKKWKMGWKTQALLLNFLDCHKIFLGWGKINDFLLKQLKNWLNFYIYSLLLIILRLFFFWVFFLHCVRYFLRRSLWNF